MYFYIKNILKNNFYHNLKHIERVRESLFLRFNCIFENFYFFYVFRIVLIMLLKIKFIKNIFLKIIFITILNTF
jgi:hypothetical protein